MLSQYFPMVGQWYRDFSNQIFEVVAMDEEENTIEIQYFGGEVDELDFEAWYGLGAESVPAPEDWSGMYDEFDDDERGYSDAARSEPYLTSFEDLE